MKILSRHKVNFYLRKKVQTINYSHCLEINLHLVIRLYRLGLYKQEEKMFHAEKAIVKRSITECCFTVCMSIAKRHGM